jgi:hypothetical protein
MKIKRELSSHTEATNVEHQILYINLDFLYEQDMKALYWNFKRGEGYNLYVTNLSLTLSLTRTNTHTLSLLVM